MQGLVAELTAMRTSELDYRSRLIAAMVDAVTDKGFAQTTIADVARRARVSKRTFYEHFSDKEECFLSAYAAVNDLVLARIAIAAQGELHAEAKLDAAIDAYVSALEERPAMTRAFLTEIQAAGPKALLLRRSVLERYADLLRLQVDNDRLQRPELTALSPPMATAIVGGINELLLLSSERGAARFADIGRTARELIRRIVLGAPGTARPKRKHAAHRPARARQRSPLRSGASQG